MIHSQEITKFISLIKDIKIPNIFPFIFFFFLTIIPIEVFILGEGYGYGIRGMCYKYQITGLGDSFIPINYEFQYILSGLISGRNMYATFVWAGGALIFGISTMLMFIGQLSDLSINKKNISNGIFLSVGLFLLSDIIHYGPLFFGPSGIAIPFGIPFLLYLGWVIREQDSDPGQKPPDVSQ